MSAEIKKTVRDGYWITLGASAGGLEALNEFLQNFNGCDDCYVVIAQHLDPKHPTILKDLLSRYTELPIELLTEDKEPKAGTIYIIAPGHNAIVDGGKIKLLPAAAIGPKPSIDLFLHSLAEYAGEKAIAVILSGTGSDGAQGSMAVKANNGTVFVQDNKSAKYSGMPDATIEAGVADVIQAPKKLAKKVSEFIRSSDLTILIDDDAKPLSELEQMFKIIFEQTGMDFSGYKLKTINRRIARRMAVHHIKSLDKYLELLRKSVREVESLSKDFLISVTEFFRDQEAFQDLKKVVDELVDRTSENEVIRVWVPGCANGEEAYSISILFHQALLTKQKSISYQVFASDIDDFALSQARKGFYSAAQIDDVEQSIRDAFFQRKEDRYQVTKTIRDKVVFAHQNVITDPPFSKIDLVSCRNLLIYFSGDLQRKVLQTFHFALKAKGFLFLGRSESATSTSPDLFDSYIKRSQIFIRRNIDISPAIDQLQSANNYARASEKANRAILPKERKTLGAQVEKILMEEMMPVTVLVDNNGQILNIRGDIQRYFEFPQGAFENNVITLARSEIKMDLRALINQAHEKGSATAQSLFYSGEDKELLFVHIRKVSLQKDSTPAYLIAFLPAKVDENFFINPTKLNEKQRLANDSLEHQVALFKERLQTSIEDLETTNEELQSTNEELQSANEELQSTNEELQTSNEELQSTNEELSTVNQELEVKSNELEQANSDLENMLANMDEVVVLLDTRLRIVRFTKAAQKKLNFSQEMLNHTITTIGLDIDLPNLRNELLDVLDYRQVGFIQARQGKQSYKVRLVPYENERGKMSGVMMFFDCESARSPGPHIDDLIKPMSLVADEVDYSLLLIDKLGTMVFANLSVLNLTGYHTSELFYKNIKMLLPEPLAVQNDKVIGDYLFGDANHNWRDISFRQKSGDRLLLKVKMDELLIGQQNYYLMRVLTLEEFAKRYIAN